MLHQQISRVLSHASVYNIDGMEENSYALFFELLGKDADAMIAVLKKHDVVYNADKDDSVTYITCYSEYDEICKGIKAIHDKNKKKKRFICKSLYEGRLMYSININDSCIITTDGNGNIFMIDSEDSITRHILRMFNNYTWQSSPYMLRCSGTLKDFQYMARRILHEIPNKLLKYEERYKGVSCGSLIC